ncbi:MAG: membrane protein [Methylibium sp. NZG]|nr:MAG: membrane protein [Methylibium sp. NZG]
MALGAAGSVAAQPATQAAPPAADALRQAAQQAVQSNPDVTARYNAYRASGHEREGALAAYRPRVDATAQVGHTRDRFDNRNPASQSLGHHGVGLNLTQMLWDGHATRSEVQRLDHNRMARWFEFVDASEQAALEAARAHYDVQRFRRLVELAEDNYIQHKVSHDQIQDRFKAGVGRGVDLQQAVARLALAESNLNSEVANLHDVTARFQRVVGAAPAPAVKAGAASAAATPVVELSAGVPTSAAEALRQATTRNASVSAAIESMRAIRSQTEALRSADRPRIEARLRGGLGKNLAGQAGQTQDIGAEIVLNWSLFDGGRNHARTRQFADLLGQAADQRDRACRDVRQTVSIAHNDTARLAEQVRYLEKNAAAIQRARDAYRQQFEIGQRSLLDLLNAENEAYTARRAVANAEFDRAVAYVRVHAAMNTLLPTLGLVRADAAAGGAGAAGADSAAGWQAGDDAAGRCAVVEVAQATTPLTELDARAQALAASRAAVPATPTRP